MRLIDADQFKKYRTELTDDMSPLERMYLIGRNDMVAIIESAPTVEYRWIPVTESLPEECDTVLMWHKDGFVMLSINAFDVMDEVTHWMPLPAAPEEGE